MENTDKFFEADLARWRALPGKVDTQYGFVRYSPPPQTPGVHYVLMHYLDDGWTSELEDRLESLNARGEKFLQDILSQEPALSRVLDFWVAAGGTLEITPRGRSILCFVGKTEKPIAYQKQADSYENRLHSIRSRNAHTLSDLISLLGDSDPKFLDAVYGDPELRALFTPGGVEVLSTLLAARALRQIDVEEAAAKKVLAEVSNRRDTVKMFLK